MLKKLLAGALLSCCVAGGAVTMSARAQDAKAAEPNVDGWVSLFDGTTLNGWKANEHPESFKVEDGQIVVNGQRGHLFYEGDGQLQPFVNFEWKAEVKTMPNSNSGVFIHTQTQPDGWPSHGYECQVNSTQGDPIKTGSLYNVVNVLQVPTKEGEPFASGVRVERDRVSLTVAKAPSTDNEWFTYSIRVEGKRIITRVNGITLVDYTEPEGLKRTEGNTRPLDKGTFALQAHDPGSKVFFRNIQVRRLP